MCDCEDLYCPYCGNLLDCERRFLYCDKCGFYLQIDKTSVLLFDKKVQKESRSESEPSAISSALV